jgi:hypothetical protein
VTSQLTIADLLRKYSTIETGSTSDMESSTAFTKSSDPMDNTERQEHRPRSNITSEVQAVEAKASLFTKARQDVIKMAEVLELSTTLDELARTRLEVLRKYL